MDKFILSVIDALLWFIVGMVFTARLYCAKYNITGADYIGWDTVAVVVGGIAGIRLLMWFDPSFRRN
jgi:hypothetical protein